MADRQVRIGSFGPFTFRDSDYDSGVETDSEIKASGITVTQLSEELRIIYSNEEGHFAEVINLIPFLLQGIQGDIDIEELHGDLDINNLIITLDLSG